MHQRSGIPQTESENVSVWLSLFLCAWAAQILCVALKKKPVVVNQLSWEWKESVVCPCLEVTPGRKRLFSAPWWEPAHYICVYVWEEGRKWFRERHVYVLIQNTWPALMNKSELVNGGHWVCVCLCVYACVGRFSSLAHGTGVHVEMCSGRGKQALDSQRWSSAQKNGSLLEKIFSLTAAKLLKSGEQSPIWQPHVHPDPCVFKCWTVIDRIFVQMLPPTTDAPRGLNSLWWIQSQRQTCSLNKPTEIKLYCGKQQQHLQSRPERWAPHYYSCQGALIESFSVCGR